MGVAMNLGDRMKEYYERRAQVLLPRRTNILIRLDGVGFSKFTRGLHRPFDQEFMDAMDSTAAELCKRIQGAKCAFVQSDEITILLTDYDSNETDGYYDNSIQKICSVTAGMATAHFNRVFAHKVKDVPGFFDSRVFTIPFAQEVVNCFLWRQQDCTRNSIASVAQVLYSHKELHGKSSNEQQELIYQKGEELRLMMIDNGTLPVELHEKLNLNWNDLPTGMKRGRFITRKAVVYNDGVNPQYTRNHWIAEGAPIFSKDRESILALLPAQHEEEEEDIKLS